MLNSMLQVLGQIPIYQMPDKTNTEDGCFCIICLPCSIRKWSQEQTV